MVKIKDNYNWLILFKPLADSLLVIFKLGNIGFLKDNINLEIIIVLNGLKVV